MTIQYGSQFPTDSVILPYEETDGFRAIERYEESGRSAQPWQKQMVCDVRAINNDGLYVHPRFGYQVPRRNGKGEILTIIEIDDLCEGKCVLHTAHRTTTSTSAALRLARIFSDLGYSEVQRVKKGEKYEKSYTFVKTIGLEKITLLDTGGTISFRTRTAAGGLGEGFDTLVIDEAQECTKDQRNSLQYCVSDSENSQIIFCGTPPTLISKGDVFQQMRSDVLSGKRESCGWAEWSVDGLHDVDDEEAWKLCNPAIGYQLSIRDIQLEDKSDRLDFNIQRLGYWSNTNLQSSITKDDWSKVQCDKKPIISNDVYIGIKYGADGTNVAMSIASKTNEGKIFVESIDCRQIRDGNEWIIGLLKRIKAKSVVVDGKGQQDVLANYMKDEKIKGIIIPTTNEVVVANTMFEKSLYGETLCHFNQPSLTQSATNCAKRTIGTGGGFGYKSIKPAAEIALLESVCLAHWACANAKEKKQIINY